jgi:hypothetical protein
MALSNIDFGVEDGVVEIIVEFGVGLFIAISTFGVFDENVGLSIPGESPSPPPT